MTPERIAELRELADSATPGPWTVSEETRKYFAVVTPEFLLVDDIDRWDAAFIAASRTAVPELLDEVERLADIIKRTTGIKVYDS